MNASPGPDGLLEGVIIGLQEEVLPYVSNPRAQATVQMMQSILQGLRQLLPVYERYLIDEHNAMTATLRSAAAELGDTPGPEADRIRHRAATLGQIADLPEPTDRGALIDTHLELGRALEASIADLDVIQRAGGDAAAAGDRSLSVIRGHLAPRIARDIEVFTASAGMIGRG
jgi:hypothetical protein